MTDLSIIYVTHEGNLMEADWFVKTLENLSIRKQEVLRLVAEGKKDSDIAKTLDISDETVRQHISRMYSAFELDAPKRKLRQRFHALLRDNQDTLNTFFNRREDIELQDKISVIIRAMDSDDKKIIKLILTSSTTAQIITMLRKVIVFFDSR